ncbi:MAG: glucose-1-phosphate thymidylyltransferase, partial [Muribaculaceae bacterium]|nr:glucose-1-phosphate thymidylyltransferase [Muribaculaceae bacterium]
MNIALTDIKDVRDNLLPLTFTRPVALLRTGIGTIADHWRRALPNAQFSFVTEDYLAKKFPADKQIDLYIAGHVLPCPALTDAITSLPQGGWIADPDLQPIVWHEAPTGEPSAIVEVKAITQPYHLFTLSKELITADFHALTASSHSQPISDTCTVIGDPSLVFIEEGADVEGCFLNTRQGPIYIGRDAEVQEAVVLRGPVCIDAGSRVRAGARLLPGTNLGPKCKVGGEVGNAIFLANANKQHDGYLGDAVIGEWCNLGAGCTSSNLKNDYTEIRLW